MPITKQELATKIWDAANKMRGKIEANDYKDFLLGFIFYKFVSEKEEEFILKNDGTEEDIKALGDKPDEFCQRNLGYYIPYKYLFSTWVNEGSSLTAAEVNEALQSFERSLHNNFRETYTGIFSALQTGISSLGDSSGSRDQAVRDLLGVVNEIPMDEKSYDVLGFVYEYLIKMFASSAGKKGGEFYTPYMVGVLCARILAHHLQHKDHISVYDCCSGSCGLLLDIAKEWEKYSGNSEKVEYYGQELINKTFHLGRMNMLMRGVNPSNLKLRNGDTLKDDWPYFSDKEPYRYLPVSACANNPPYSASWDPSEYENDPRFKYGLAPKSKADYAFFLHNLYHLDEDGIMTIVLPHGVLFRGGSEEEIRRNLIENNHIDTIIGLPANIFFGTGIPTIVIVARKHRERDDVLFIDASNEFIKAKTKNEMTEEHISKIFKAYLERKDVDKFAHLATKQEIIDNGYNLNIPRYVDTTEKETEIDIDEVRDKIAKIRKEESEAIEIINKMMAELGIRGI